MYGISFEQWVFMFFIFTMIGWIHETTVESLYHKKFVNRGSLHGPYIPIYGFGGCGMIIFAYPFRSNGFFAFLSGLICSTVLEYFTGWLMETVFHRQFWDYSMMKLTYKNRISLVSSLCWGFMSLFMVYMLFPFMQWFCGLLGSFVMIIFDCIMMIIVSIDMIVVVRKNIGWRNIAKKLSPEQIKAALQNKRRQVGNIFGHFTAILRRENRQAKKEADKLNNKIDDLK
ncbi:MAG: putative ABC transporter permease [Ruminiclostridium sp.]|nr:putative ABC transporter permease [Ruminiclostridium sp.]